MAPNPPSLNSSSLGGATTAAATSSPSSSSSSQFSSTIAPRPLTTTNLTNKKYNSPIITRSAEEIVKDILGKTSEDSVERLLNNIKKETGRPPPVPSNIRSNSLYTSKPPINQINRAKNPITMTSITKNKKINFDGDNDDDDIDIEISDIEDDPVEVSLKVPVKTNKTSSSNSHHHIMSTMNGISSINNSKNSRIISSRDSSLYDSRSPSPISTRSSLSSSYYDTNYSRHLRSSLTPRRIYPQTYTGTQNGVNLSKLNSMEQSPVVFDANLSFVLGCKRQPVRQTVRASPSHTEPQTASNELTTKIQDFLQRTDHVMEEWNALGKRSGRRRRRSNDATLSLVERQKERRERDPSADRTHRSRSVTNILIKGYQLSQSLPPTERSSNSMTRESVLSHDDDRTIIEGDEETPSQ